MIYSLIIIYLGLPALLLYIGNSYSFITKVSPILICYVLGLFIGNSGLLPEGADGIQSSLTDVSIALALPMLLFSTNISEWRRLAGKAILSMILASVSVLIIAVLLFFIFRSRIDDAWQLPAMAVGLYTGGTPNLAAIKTALTVDDTRYILFHGYDLVAGILYLLIALSSLRILLTGFLKPFDKTNSMIKDGNRAENEYAVYQHILQAKNLKYFIIVFVLSGSVLGLSMLISQLLPGDNKTAWLVLMLTSFGLLFSFNDKIRKLPHSYAIGMYLIYIFSIVVASMADLQKLAHINWPIFSFVFATVFFSFALHAILSRAFNVDADTFLVTSVSAVCSPPFVPAVSAAIRNQGLIAIGITTGIIGYALGNYFGISLGLLLKLL